MQNSQRSIVTVVTWEPDDVKRSIRRYLAMTLPGPPWVLRVERREVKDEQRPVGVITDGQITTIRGGTPSVIQGNVEEMLPVTVTLYPLIADASTDSLRASRLEADQLKAQLNELLNTGLTVTTEVEGKRRHWAGPFRIPLWDYTGVPLTGEEKAGPEEPHDVLWVEEASLSVNTIQDTEDPRRWTVVANFRVTLERPGRVPGADEMMDVTGVAGSFAGEPG